MSILLCRNIYHRLKSLKTAQNTKILAALTQRWFYIVTQLSGFRKVLRKSLLFSFYLYITIFLCLFSSFDFWFLLINYEQQQKKYLVHVFTSVPCFSTCICSGGCGINEGLVLSRLTNRVSLHFKGWCQNNNWLPTALKCL